jgi:hypothetical protein
MNPTPRHRIIVTRTLTVVLWILIAVVSGPLAWARAGALRAAIPEPADDMTVAVATGVGAIDAHVDEPVVLASVELQADGYWAIQAAAGEALYGIGVVAVEGTARPVGGITRIPIEPRLTRAPLVDEVQEIDPASTDPITVAVRGWVEGWLTGADVLRFAAPDLGAGTVGRPYGSATVTHLGGRYATGRTDVMLVRAVVHVTAPEEQLEMSVVVVDRGDGTWEVTELLAAPPVG